ncbi:hypothetical protein FMEAI12_7030001 [Parafrankia sp. Ea1.12]|nr:hypothetical protein FMEAI12_7030001 [Parafrankia sp. Ea1.12]
MLRVWLHAKASTGMYNINLFIQQ